MTDKIQGVINFFDGEIIMDNIGQDRINAVIRNILSGNNNCSTLAKACYEGNGQYFYNAIAPIVAVYASELADMTRQRNEYSKEYELKRYALESVMSNIPKINVSQNVIDAVEAAMPGRKW